MGQQKRGLFITFEGMEGCGKTTQVRLLAEYLRHMGHSVTTTREPGGCAISDRIRAVLLDPEFGDSMDPVTELHLFCAARYQHCVDVIWPAVARGDIVLCDRFADSTIAYQGFARDVIPPADIVQVTDKLLNGRWPDLTFILTPDTAEECLTRALHRYTPEALRRHKDAKLVDIKEARFDRMSLDFHRRVHKAFAQQVDYLFRFHKRLFCQVYASRSILEIQESIQSELFQFMQSQPVGLSEVS